MAAVQTGGEEFIQIWLNPFRYFIVLIGNRRVNVDREWIEVDQMSKRKFY